MTSAVQSSKKAAHGRQEVREMWALSDPDINAYVGSAGTVGEPWPYLQQVCALRRQRTLKGKTTLEVAYLVTSLPVERADAAQLLRDNRAYWGIENRLHWQRDELFAEDRCQVRTGSAPQVLAGLRNLVLTLLHRGRCGSPAAALRTFAGRPREAVRFVLSFPLLK